MKVDSRKQAERDFHNRREELRLSDRYEHDTYYTNRRFYAICGRSRSFIQDWYQQECTGKRILDYCCGTGGVAIDLARAGHQVTGIDISDVSIETCRAEAEKARLAERTDFCVMDAENLDFSDDSFDIIVCSGVLHHLDLERAYQELARVLKPCGKILCIEALSHNFLINWYRRSTPHLRTPWEIDHILKVQDIRKAKSYFANVDVKYFHLASIAAIPLVNKPGFRFLLSTLNLVDEVLLRVPLVRRQAWQAVFVLSKPHKFS